MATVSRGGTTERFGFIKKYGKALGIESMCAWLKVSRSGYVDFDQSKILSKIKVKTLILWGANDKVIHVDSATFLDSEIPNTKIIIIKNAGHVIVVEKPELVANYFIKDNRINLYPILYPKHLRTISSDLCRN